MKEILLNKLRQPPEFLKIYECDSFSEITFYFNEIILFKEYKNIIPDNLLPSSDAHH